MITKDQFIVTLREKSIKLFDYKDIFTIFGLESENAVNSLLLRLKKAQVIRQLTKGKYVFPLASSPAEDFEIANFLYSPSYVSLETALSFYGIIDQFPYTITSVTINRAKSFKVQEKEFVYAQTKPEYYCDYLNENGILIASKVKAVFDFLYLAYKGGRGKGNLSLMNFSRDLVTKKEVRDYLCKTAGKKEKNFIKFCQNQNII